jgi:hypothetical protein
MRDSSTKRPDTIPYAVGEITRLACAHAAANGVSVDVLLGKAGLSTQQIENPDARFEVRRQIKFLNLVAEALDDDLLGFHLAQKFDFRRAMHPISSNSSQEDKPSDEELFGPFYDATICTRTPHPPWHIRHALL